MPSKGWGSSAGGGGTSLARASASSHVASDSRASWQPASAFSDEIRAASASADRRSSAGSWARRSALPASRIRWASRTAPLSSLILVSQVRAALSVSSGLPYRSLATRNSAWRRSFSAATRRGSAVDSALSTRSRRMS